MKVLVLGGAGFIGSVLCEYLTKKGDKVIIFDNLLYPAKVDVNKYDFIRGDVCSKRDLESAFENCDAVVNLAAISNDPASDLSPNLTREINFRANKNISDLAYKNNKRVVFISSCSVYGFKEKGFFKETSRLNPVSLYAKTKMLSEKFYMKKSIDSVILRLATVYGYSNKPRFDLVVNTMIGTAFFKGEIIVNGGEQWRPVVHVMDTCEAIYLALHAKKIKSKIYNIGSNDQNYKIVDLGRKIAEIIGDVKFSHKRENLDKRSYKVDFSKVQKELKLRCIHTLKDAVLELFKAFEAGEVKNMNQDVYFRVKYLKKHLTSSHFREKKLIAHIVL